MTGPQYDFYENRKKEADFLRILFIFLLNNFALPKIFCVSS